VHWPYSLDSLDCFMATQWAAALLLTAMMVFWRVPRLAFWLLLGGIWTAALSLLLPQSFSGLTFKPGPDALPHLWLAASLLGALATAAAMRPVLMIVALLGVYPLWWVAHTVKSSDAELSALYLAWLGLLAGLLGRGAPPRLREPEPQPAQEPSYALHDAMIFAGATALAALVCVFVMHKREAGADEWGYTYQAAVFAKARVYATAPRCESYFESFYVFDTSGRMFSQYPPGWPLFLVPFLWARVLWMGAPVSLGLFAWAMARLGRTAMRAYGAWDAPPSAAVVRAAGTWAGVLSGTATSLVTNGASRYPHVYTLALYAWMLEATMQTTTPGLPRKKQVLWGLVLGTVAVHGMATRPADGAFMGIGVALYFLYALARRRVGWRALATAAASFAVWSAVMLVILRVQLGKWFTTGYSLEAVIHPWNIVKYSKPQLHEWKYGLPLATGAYCWWPACVAAGLAGLARLRGRALSLVFMFVVSCVPYTVFCMYLDLGQRGVDWGIGPRYLMVLAVPLALGSAVALAPLTRAALSHGGGARSAFVRGGPLAVALVAIVSAWVRIVPEEWATIADHVHKHSAVNRAIDDAHLDHAVVLVTSGTTSFDALDLTTNLPIDLYPNQDVLIAIDRGQPQDAEECLRAAYPGRRLYRASGREDVHVVPAEGKAR
jgi:hypothetical protein